MLACQYVFDLPTRFDMTSIRRRVAERGPAFDVWPGLVMKAFMIDEASRGGGNAYATFYVWRTAEALRSFLDSSAFAAVVETFGRPTVRTWLVDRADLPPGGRVPRTAVQQRHALPAGRPPRDSLAILGDLAAGWRTVGRAVAFDPADWQATSLLLLDDDPIAIAGDLGCERVWEVLHLSMPAAARERDLADPEAVL